MQLIRGVPDVEFADSIIKWWATLPHDQWPTQAIESVLSDFDDPKNDKQDPSTDSVNNAYQVETCESLDKCLSTDDQWLT
jgi:hypothetical protein